MQRVMKLIAVALVVLAIIGYRTHRGTAETTRTALHDSAGRNGAYVQFAHAQRIRVDLKSPDAAGGYIDAFRAIASTRDSDAVANCLKETFPWTGQADCSPSGRVRTFALRALRARLVTALFPDGSARTYVFDGDTGNYVPVPGSARDRSGNGIPENVAMASNGGGLDTYVFQGADAGQDQARFVRQLVRLGIGGDYTGGDNRQPITCVARPDGTVCLHAL